MADTDQSISNLRYNQVSQELEGAGGGTPIWSVLTLTNPFTGGVSSIHADGAANLTGNVQLVSGTSITLSQVGQAITINGTGVSAIHADGSANLTGSVQFVSGTNVTLSQVGQAITVNATGGGSSVTPSVQAEAVIRNTYTGAFTATPLASSFTLSSASNKVKVSMSGALFLSDISMYATVTLFVDGVNVVTNGDLGINALTAFGNAGSTTDGFFVPSAFSYLHAPGDTAPHTYAVAIATTGGNAQYPGVGKAILILEEIA